MLRMLSRIVIRPKKPLIRTKTWAWILKLKNKRVFKA